MVQLKLNSPNQQVCLRSSFVALAVISTLFSCNNNCPVDQRFSDTFNVQLECLDNSQLTKRAVYTKDVLGAIRFMMELTGTGAYLTDNDPWYANKGAYLKDRKVWTDWYEKNKCTFTYEMMDSTLCQTNFYKYFDLEIKYPDNETDFEER